MLIIGDVHTKVNAYEALLNKHKPDFSIQVGDFGFKKSHDWHIANLNPDRHKINFGNHDYYPYLRKPHSLGDYYTNSKRKLMTIRGAFSIDHPGTNMIKDRVEGVDWFRDEEMDYATFNKCVSAYETFKPEIVISHDSPQSVRQALFGNRDKSITSNGLQACFEIHQPKLWVFGHHHRSRKEIIDGTKFICLAELEALEI